MYAFYIKYFLAIGFDSTRYQNKHRNKFFIYIHMYTHSPFAHPTRCNINADVYLINKILFIMFTWVCVCVCIGGSGVCTNMKMKSSENCIFIINSIFQFQTFFILLYMLLCASYTLAYTFQFTFFKCKKKKEEKTQAR